MTPESRVVLIRLVHTLVWALFAGCVIAIPLLAWMGAVRGAAICAAIVAIEILVPAVNGWRCPLTDVAAGRWFSTRISCCASAPFDINACNDYNACNYPGEPPWRA